MGTPHCGQVLELALSDHAYCLANQFSFAFKPLSVGISDICNQQSWLAIFYTTSHFSKLQCYLPAFIQWNKFYWNTSLKIPTTIITCNNSNISHHFMHWATIYCVPSASMLPFYLISHKIYNKFAQNKAGKLGRGQTRKGLICHTDIYTF